MAIQKGRIYICGTPLGNLDDITFRVLKTLKKVDLIAAEDTRRTARLLNYFEINKPLTSYHEHNEKEKTDKLINELLVGKEIALVSDAGMPGISDPGLEIIKQAIDNEIELIPVPGPTAVVSALVVSGLSMERFVFEGFLPRKGRERQERLEKIQLEERTVIFYESPYRIKDTLQELAGFIRDRKVALVREISKVHEEKIYGSVCRVLDIIKDREVKGEIVLVIEGNQGFKTEKVGWEELTVYEHLKLMIDQGIPKKRAIKEVSAIRDLPKREVYREAVTIEVDKK